MPTYPKEKCEICGQMVTTMAAGRKVHMNKHARREDIASAPVAEEKQPEVGVAVKLNPKQAEELKAATAADARLRAEAPDILAHAKATPDYLSKLASLFFTCTNEGERAAARPRKHTKVPGPKFSIVLADGRTVDGYHPYWGRCDARDMNIAEGKLPVFDNEGQKVQHGDVELYAASDIVRNANESAAGRQSHERFMAATEKGTDSMKGLSEDLLPEEAQVDG